MFRGFKIEAISFPNSLSLETGKRLFDNQKVIIENQLKKFINGNNPLDGSKIQANWFPQITADIFISHSHKDKDNAVALAGWLWNNFKISSFIDSLIWGYANDLLKEIDDTYCLNDEKTAYDYNTRNYSTSHVHMMLSTALAMMIDKTECLFFLDTPNSICPKEKIKKTESAWIYFEMATSQLVQKRQPIRQILERTKHFSEVELLEKSLQVNYRLDLNHLTEITVESLNAWKRGQYSSAEDALDNFYKLNPPKKISDSLHS